MSEEPKYKLQDLIDIEQFQALQDRLNEIYSFPSAIIDNDGNVLTATAWQDICTQFHRKNKECEKECIKSDQYILAHLADANPAVSYRCPHGLVDNATPIIIDGIHYGNFFTGQFFLEKPDSEFFRNQAKIYGFAEEAYLEAVMKAPIWSQKQLENYLYFIKGLIEVISSSGYKKLKEIAARKKIEENEERAGAILSQMSDGFWATTGQGGKIVDANPAMCEMLGYTRAEMLNISIKDVEAIDSSLDIEQRIQQIIRDGSAHFESRFRRKDGLVLDVEVSVTYLQTMDMFFGFHRDVTARKQVEKERESLLVQVTTARDEIASAKDLLNGIMERVSDGFVAFDADFNYTYVNPHGAELLGREVDDLIGKNYWIEYPEARGTPFANAYVRAMETQQPIFFEDYYVHWDRWFINRIYPSKEGITIFFTDITERKRADEALRRLNRELRAISECSQILVRAEEENNLLYDVCRVVCDEAGYRMAWVGYAENDQARTVRPVAWAGMENGYLAAANVTWDDAERGRGPVGSAIRSGQSVLIQDFSSDPRVGAWRENALQRGYQSCIALPLKDESANTFGVFAIYSAEPNAFTRDEIRLLEELAADLAFGIVVLRARVAHKQAEDALRSSEALFRAVVENSYDGMILMGADRKPKYVSPSYSRISGFLPEEWIGGYGPDYIHPEDQAYVAGVFSRVLDNPVRPINLEYRLRHKQGHWFWVETTATNLLMDPLVKAVVLNSRDITERKQREKELQTISSLSAALRTAPTRAQMFPVIVQQIAGLLRYDAVIIEMLDPLTGDTVVEAGQGLWQPLIGRRQMKGIGINAIIRETLHPYHSHAFEADPDLVCPPWAKAGIHGAVGVPLIAHDQLIGFIWVGAKVDIPDAEVGLLSAIANIAANAIHRATLFEQTQTDAAELALAYDTTLEGWAYALELRDQETEGHSRRVTHVTLKLARHMGVNAEDLEDLRRGALLHDIGKMGIPDAVLLKPGPLNEAEWEIMRRHPENAFNLLNKIDYLLPALDIPYCHHEKWDGTGYPRGLKGEQIPLGARIFAIVDVWDALTNDRPYRPAWSKEYALNYICEQSEKHFDPQVVKEFLNLLAELKLI